MLSKNFKRILWILSIIIIVLIVGIIFFSQKDQTGEIAMLGISSDGHYAISTDAKGLAILWDIKNKQKTIIAQNTNTYSAYWVKNTPYFIWQSLDKTVHVMDVNTRQEIKTLHPNFLVFGEAISSDLKNYIASDVGYNVFLFSDGSIKQLASYYSSADFDGANKVINFTFLNNDTVLASGMAMADAKVGPTLWDLTKGKTIRNYIGNMVQTFANISPDGQYVVAGDSEGLSFVWNTQTGKQLFEVDDLMFGHYDPNGFDPHSAVRAGSFDPSTIIAKEPPDFGSGSAANGAVMSIKFIDATHYLSFMGRDIDESPTPYAILYKVDDPRAQKYIPLGRHPYPALYYYERDQAIDTAPDAHILVMGKENEGGILVYQYDPEKQTLTKIWNGN